MAFATEANCRALFPGAPATATEDFSTYIALAHAHMKSRLRDRYSLTDLEADADDVETLALIEAKIAAALAMTAYFSRHAPDKKPEAAVNYEREAAAELKRIRTDATLLNTRPRIRDTDSLERSRILTAESEGSSMLSDNPKDW